MSNQIRPVEDFTFEMTRDVAFNVYYIPLNPKILEHDTLEVQKIINNEGTDNICDPGVITDPDLLNYTGHKLPIMRCYVRSGSDEEVEKLNEKLISRPTAPLITVF